MEKAMTKLTRRAALTVAAGAAAACAPTPSVERRSAAREAAAGAFAHGVASGDPSADGFVVWSRLSGAEGPVSARFEVSETADFSMLAGEGDIATGPERDYTLKAEVAGLAAGKRYFYRFRQGDAVSPVGRAKTLPTGALAAARFAVVSCSNFPFGYFNVYDAIAAREDIDAAIHLGDYIYEYSRDGYGGADGARLGREHEPPHEILTLADYRRRHAQYKADPASQAFHASLPLIAIWDDHESANDSWRDGAENHDEAGEGPWPERKRAAMQAYYEWMPIREPKAGAPHEAIFRDFSFGDLLTITALETRLMARAAAFEYDEIVPTLTDAAAIDNFKTNILWAEDRDMLGEAQRAFVEASLSRARTAGQPWRIIANQVIMAKVTAPNLEPHVTEQDLIELEREWPPARSFIKFSTMGLPTNLDAWDGYPAAREKLYETMQRTGAEGVIVITGDTHTWWANDLVAKDGRRVGVELGAHSVTSPSPYRKAFLGGKGEEYALLTGRDNKDVRYINGEDHGYIDLHVTREKASADFIAVDTIEAPDYGVFVKCGFDIKKSAGVAQFASVRGLTLKQRAVF
jgi:phosphodiesterase/alkaline phosphatase D-like protein